MKIRSERKQAKEITIGGAVFIEVRSISLGTLKYNGSEKAGQHVIHEGLLTAGFGTVTTL